MTTNIILLTHENLGRALAETASKTYSDALDFITVIPVHNYDNPDYIFQDIDNLISNPDQAGNAYLVLTDLFGATPCNIAQKLLNRYPENALRIITGLNLPMLLKVINYRDADLETLTEKALSGGKEGITLCNKCN
jgi:PTS system mannose-specific IIA component